MKAGIRPKSRPLVASQRINRLMAKMEMIAKEREALEEKYRNTIEYANDAILTTDSKGRISSFNRKAEQMFGYTREEILGKPASILLPAERRKEAEERFKTMSLNFNRIHSGSIQEGTGMTKDGRRFPIEGSFFLIRLEGEYAVTGIIRDISERKRMEERLLASEERARVILNTMPGIAVMTDEKGVLIDCNQGLCLRLNKSKGELLGKTPLDFFDKDVAQKRRKFFKKAVLERIPVRFQDRHRGRWFDHFVHPVVDAQGTVTHVVIFAHDITELKQKEEDIAATRDKLKALAMEVTTIEENARRTFSSYLHDRIGQTLFVLKIRLEMMAKSAAGGNPEAWQEIFKLMEKAVNDTRALSYEMSPSILNELGFEAALEWLVDETNKEQNLKVLFTCDRKPIVMDRNLCTILYRAVRELITNVVKHANARNVIISLHQDGHAVHLEIKDDGIGFDTGILQLLPDSKKGFGLFSIKERLQWYKGDMIVTSAPGQGTHVMLSAPLS